MSDTLPLAATLAAAHPEEAAALLTEFSTEENAALLTALEAAPAAALLTAMPPAQGAACLDVMPPGDAVARLARMSPKAASALLRILSTEKKDALLAGMSRTRQFQVGLVLRQPSRTVGAWMDSAVIPVRIDATASSIRTMLARESRIPTNLFVVDNERRLAGSVALSDILAAADDARVDGLYTADGPFIRANAGLETALADPGWHNHDELPVIDHNGQLVGAIRFAALRQAMAEDQAPARSPEPRNTGSIMDIADLCYIGMARAMDASIARRKFDAPARKEDGRD